MAVVGVSISAERRMDCIIIRLEVKEGIGNGNGEHLTDQRGSGAGAFGVVEGEPFRGY